ncbi:MAG: phosphoribosylamine--glycine ligase [Gammaproteobacteria bacterium]
MKILIVGNGGREHALAWKVAQSPMVTQVFVAPGNTGTRQESKVLNVAIPATDIAGLKQFAQEKQIDLTIVGPEAPLVAGIVDSFLASGLRCFGPSKAAVQLEASKSFAKEFLQRHHIPTAAYACFTDTEAAYRYIDQQTMPIVIKADGLAGGKGVIIAESKQAAHTAIDLMLKEQRFGKAGHQIVIEEFLTGEEASFIVMVDGKHVLPLATSQDHKRRDDGDQGPNTGGMGAYSPAPVVTDELFKRIMETVIYPTVEGMIAEGRPYTGFLYAGVMITPEGIPKVLEYNCRLGDPETQPIMLRLQSDLVEICLSALNGELDKCQIAWDPRPALGVVMAAEGYPDSPRIRDVIYGLDIPDSEDCKVFHAGTNLAGNQIETNGGRVLCVTAKGATIHDAQKRAYQRISQIHWTGSFYRSDIGHRAL